MSACVLLAAALLLATTGVQAGTVTPAKVLVVHQFRRDMIVDPANFARVDGVDLLIDMDGWGLPEVKLDGYAAFASAPYAEYSGFKLFFNKIYEVLIL